MAKIDIKIDWSKLKAGMGALRSLSVMLWPLVIVIAGAAIIAAAYLMGRSFMGKVRKESIPLGNQIKTLTGSAIPESQIDIEKQYQDAYQIDANTIEKLAIQSSQRGLISYEIFPVPKDTSKLLFTNYAKKFRQGIEELIASVNGKDCPGEEEIKNVMQRSTPVSGFGQRTSERAAVAEKDRILDEYYQSRAKTASVYVNPEDIAGYIFWGDYQYKNLEQGVKDCWIWQIGYWIEEDVFTTVEKMNAGSGSIFSSPVKRIKGVGFVTPDKFFTGERTGEGQMAQEPPKFVNNPGDQMTEACTARVSNDDVNVVHFGVAVIVDTKYVLPFMKELCSVKEHKWRGYTGQEPERVFKHNQITILESRVRPVKPDSEEHKKYRYGVGTAAEVGLICEYIFDKKGYEPINPDMVKKPAEPAKTE